MSHPFPPRWTIIQHGTSLALANTGKLSAELFYQLALRQFGETQCVLFDPPGDVADLVRAHLEATQPDRADAAEAAAAAAATLGAKAAMLEEYFSVRIDADAGLLLGMPRLLEDYDPEPSAVPGFLYALATETEWRYEKQCFESIARALGVCYATLPSNDEHETVLNEDAELVLKTKLLPALRALLLPPEDVPDAEVLKKLTSLERIYRVFERC